MGADEHLDEVGFENPRCCSDLIAPLTLAGREREKEGNWGNLCVRVCGKVGVCLCVSKRGFKSVCCMKGREKKKRSVLEFEREIERERVTERERENQKKEVCLYLRERERERERGNKEKTKSGYE